MKGKTAPAACWSPRQFEAAAKVFKAMAHPSRAMIVYVLGQEGEHCVADLTDMVGSDMSTVSNHLTILKTAGIVETDRRGTQIFYRLCCPCITNIFCCLDEFHQEKSK
jgi:ArsR family transcriptional regulator